MVNYREILRLTSLGYSQRQIAASVHSSRSTISEVQALARKVGLTLPLDDSITNELLLKTFYPERITATNPRVEPDYNYIHKELAKSGVNLSLLWTEYCEKSYTNGLTPYMYSQFCDKYRHWARITKATMRIQHKPGDAMQVDWAGTTIPLHDKYTGDITDVYLFVAVLPCSCKAYVEPCENMKSECWLSCHAHAYSYFGGVARLLIPDNLKTGIVKNTKYETIINRSYQELAEYYGTAIVPCRVKRPQDKSIAEGSVKYVSTWIIAALRSRKFFSMQEIRDAVKEKLEELNNYPFKKREGNRNTAYLEEEKSFMKPLPLTPYEPAVWSTAKVQQDYLITDGKNKYSVPFDLIGEQVDIRLTQNTIEAYYHGSRIASHPRKQIAQRDPVIQPEHMPQQHRKYLANNQDDFRSWAKNIGSKTQAVVEFFLTSGTEPEQGYKSCSSLTKLSDRYGHERLEKACERVLLYTSEPNIRNISTILKNGQDKIPSSPSAPDSGIPNSGGISRGPAYYKRGGAR